MAQLSLHLIDAHNTLCDLIYHKKDADQTFTCPIKESLWSSVLSVASKLLSSEHCQLEGIAIEEPNLSNSFENAEIYEFLTGETNTFPEFQFNRIQPSRPAYRITANCHLFQQALAPPPIPPPQQQDQPQGPQPPEPLPAEDVAAEASDQIKHNLRPKKRLTTRNWAQESK